MADRIGADSQLGIGFETTPGTKASSLISYRFDVEMPIDIHIERNKIERMVVQSGFSPLKYVAGMKKIPASAINKELYTRGDGYFWRMLFGQTPTTTAPSDEVLLAATSIAATMSLTSQPSAGNKPAILKCTVAGATAWGTITITGTDGNGTAITETLTYTSNTTINTTKYFATVNAGGITTSGFTGGTLAINGNRNTYKHEFALANDVPSITMEISKGGYPFTYWGCGLTSAQFKVDTPEGITKGTFSFVGKDGEPKSLAGTTTPSSLSSLVKEIFLNWRCGLRIDDTLIGIKSINFTISNNLLEDTAEIKESVPLQIPRLVRGGKRTITGTINRQFEDSTYFDKWINGTSAKLSVKGTSQPYAGPLETVEFVFPTIMFEGTDPTVSDMSLMYNDLPFSAFGEGNNEATLTIYSLDANYN